jgi:uncharacterized protein YqeY
MIKEKIQKDLQDSLKAQEALKTSVLRLLASAILNREKEKRYKLKEDKDVSLNDEETLEVVMSEAKKRKEAAELYEKGARPELAEKERKELEMLKCYLPEQISQEELRKMVKEAVAKTGAKEIKDMGKVMGILMPQIKGKADGSSVSSIIKELLTPKADG